MDCVLKRSVERPGWWILADRDNLIVIRFKEKQFNDTKEVIFLIDYDDYETIIPNSPEICHTDKYKYVCMLEWLMINHRDLMEVQDDSLRSLIGED